MKCGRKMTKCFMHGILILAMAASFVSLSQNAYSADYIVCVSSASTPQQTTPTDADADGYYVCINSYSCENTTVTSQYTQPGTCETAIDCDDTNASVKPSAAEVCSNGIDDNCNGQTDEGCAVRNVVCVGFNDTAVCDAAQSTLQAGVDNASTYGAIIYVADGSYDGFLINKPNVTVQAYNGAAPVINKTGVTYSGSNTAAVRITGDNATILGLTVNNDGGKYTSAFVVEAARATLNFNNMNFSGISGSSCTGRTVSVSCYSSTAGNTTTEYLFDSDCDDIADGACPDNETVHRECTSNNCSDNCPDDYNPDKNILACSCPAGRTVSVSCYSSTAGNTTTEYLPDSDCDDIADGTCPDNSTVPRECTSNNCNDNCTANYNPLQNRDVCSGGTGTPYGVINNGTGSVDAKNNWWGSNAGPQTGGARIQGTVVFDPYLTAVFGGTIKEVGPGLVSNPVPGIDAISLDAGSVIVASYTSPPKDGDGFQAGAKYFDISNPQGVALLTVTVCDVDTIKYYDTVAAAWVTCSPITTDASGCLVLTLTSTSTPKISEITGTFFAAGKTTSPTTTTTTPATTTISGGGGAGTTSGGGGGGGTTSPVLSTTGYVKFYFPKEQPDLIVQTQTFSIRNDGGGTLQWSIGEPSYASGSAGGWITAITPKAGTGNALISVTVDSSLAPKEAGAYEATIPITSNGGNDTMVLKIGIEVLPPPALFVTPGSVTFDPDTTEQTISVGNSGTEAGTWNINILYDDKASGWLSVNPEAITLDAQDNDTVVLTVNRNNLEPDTYTATIEFLSGIDNMSAASVNVSMTVSSSSGEGSPTLAVDQESYFVKRNETTGEIKIRNSGKGTLEWNTGDIEYSKGAANWLTTAPSSGSLDAGQESTITITVDRDAVSRFGLYRATIPITSNGGNKQVTIFMWNPLFRL